MIRRWARGARRALAVAARDTPGVVFGLCILYGFLLATYTVLIPTYQAPLEPHHVDLVRAVADTGQWPAHESRQLSLQVVETLPMAAFTDVLPDGLEADLAVPRQERRTFESMGADAPSAVANLATRHPPAYHYAAGAFGEVVGRALPGAWPVAFDRLVVVLRMFGVLLVAPLPLFTYHAARRLTGSGPVALTAAVLPLGIPELAQIAATVNNDALLIAATGALAVPVAAVLAGDRRLRTALAIALLTGLALLTQGFALATVPAVGLAYLGSIVVVRRDRAARRRTAAAAALALLGALALGGWWWVRNLVVEGVLLPPGVQTTGARAPGFQAHPLGWVSEFSNAMVADFSGVLGRNDVPLSPIAIGAAALLATVGCVATFVPERLLGRHLGRRWKLAVILAPVGLLVVATAARSWGAYHRTGAALIGAQGRYLYAGLAGLVVVVAVAGAASPAPAGGTSFPR